MRTDIPIDLTQHNYDACAADVASQVQNQILRGVDPESQLWDQLYKHSQDCVANAFCSGLTIDEWVDAAVALARSGAKMAS
jgi:hypothetical protein